MNAVPTLTDTVGEPLIWVPGVAVKTNVAVATSRGVEYALSWTPNPVLEMFTIWTLLATITGGIGGIMTVAVGGVWGITFVVPATRRVSETVMLPATVPCWIAPFCGRIIVPDPASTVKSRVVPPARNCRAGSAYPGGRPLASGRKFSDKVPWRATGVGPLSCTTALTGCVGTAVG